MASSKVDWSKIAEEQELSSKVINLDIGNSSSSTQVKEEIVSSETPKKNNGNKTESKTEAYINERLNLDVVIKKELMDMKKQEQYSLEIMRKDPTSPLYSVKTFEALHLKPELLQGVYAMGFNTPSKIQETALPTLLADPPQNMIAQSQSGTGKTATFVLAMLSRVDVTKKYPQVLCLSPTYELAIQTGEVAAKMSKFCTDIKIKYAVKGEQLERGAKITEHVIIGTPGKALDWSIKFKFFDLEKISVFVLDEADIMIAMQGHQDQCIRMHKLLPKTCQMMFFSATYSEEVMEFGEIIVNNPIIIRLLKEEESLDNIKQYYVKCKDSDEKYKAIDKIYEVLSIGQAIIFCKTKKTAAWLAARLTKDEHHVAILNGDLTVEERIQVLDRFREGLETVLIATNVLARGIDIEQVTLVVNFDLPTDENKQADYETYLHRIGRTGRFGKKGIAINLVDSEESMKVCKDIETHFKRTIHFLNTEDFEAIEQITKKQ